MAAEPGQTEQGKIDYDREYVERFERAKKEANSQGLKYEYPTKAGRGWKIHLAIADIPTDPLTERVAAFTDQHRFVYKIGKGGLTEDGKGMTIYIGDRNSTVGFARELTTHFGKELPAPQGDVLSDDTQLDGNVWGRFDIHRIGNNSSVPLNLPEFHQYGGNGIPYLWNDMDLLIHWNNPTEETELEVKQRAHTVLSKALGVFYIGTLDKTFNPDFAKKK